MGPRRSAVIHRRLIVIATFMVLWSLVIGGRLFFLHVVESADFVVRAERQQQRVLEISPQRGPIYDRNGNELAVSIEVDSLYAVPFQIADPYHTASVLAEILNLSAATLESRLRSERSFVWLKRKITARESTRIRAEGIHGLYFQQESKRFYPNRELAAHVLGFVNLDDEGGGGLEYQFEEVIGGTPGKMIVRADARGRSFQRLDQPPTRGASLTTTLDQTIQYIVDKEIVRTIQETGAAGMSVVVMDPNNGEILAMSNYPQFNPNDYGQYPPRSWSNRAISHVYEPGSTFKILTAAAALEEGLTHLDEVVDGQMGSISLYGHRIRDHKPFGLISVREVLQYSSDVGIIKLGLRLGDDLFADYIDRFGFGRRTGVDLPGEERGLTKPATDWSRVSIGAISMGQEIGTTALQIANLASTVANGGTLYRPLIVRQIGDPANGMSRQIRPSGQRVMSRETALKLQEALEFVVSDGTATSAQMPGYTAAGKTGTAQKLDPETGTYSLTKHVASFTGYSPATDPMFSAVVVIDEPEGAAYHGGDVAAPVFKRIIEQVLRYRSVAPDSPGSLPRYTEGVDGPADPVLPPVPDPDANDDAIVDSWEVVDASLSEDPGFSNAPAADDRVPARLPVPDFYGKSLRQVTDDCLQLGLRCQSGGSGVAVAQAPAPGALVAPGSRVRVRFSTSAAELVGAQELQ